ncbi:MAG: hypothetical protein WCP22_00665 [Chlamydiota bacterium]
MYIRRILGSVLCSAIAALSPAYASPGDTHFIDRDALSVYFYTSTLYAYDGSYPALAAQMRDAENIGAVFLSVSMLHLAETDYARIVRDFIEAMHGENIYVHAMYLQDATILDNIALARTRTQEIIAFHNASPAQSKFDGLTLDIEPESTDEWDTESNRFGLVRELLSVMEAIHEELTDSALDLPLSSALYAHYMKNGALRSWLTVNGESVGYPSDFLRFMDFLILMSYDDDPADIVDYLQDELAYAGEDDSILAGIKTKNSGDDDTTSWQEGWEALCSAVGEVRCSLDSTSGPLLGFAVFEYESYRAMKGLAPVDLRINFQAHVATRPAGYLEDLALPYGVMGGYRFGWR